MEERDLLEDQLVVQNCSDTIAQLDYGSLANWTHEQWNKVLWTDKCRVALRAPDGREHVWKKAWGVVFANHYQANRQFPRWVHYGFGRYLFRHTHRIGSF